jgi:hypothetical protein
MYDASALYVDPYLTNFATGYRDPQYYGDILAPQTTVQTKSGKYRVFDRSNRLIFPDLRAPGTVANEVRGRVWSEDVFSTKQHSLQTFVTDEERREYASQGGLSNPAFGGGLNINVETDAVALVVGSLQRKHEKIIADTARNTATYPVGNTVTLAGAQQWDDYTNGVTSTSDPVSAILAGIRKITGLIGQPPNLLMFNAAGSSYIENHPRVVARFQYFSLAEADAYLRLTGFNGQVVQIGVGDDIYNAADNIDATFSSANFWGKDVILAYVDNADGMNIQTFMKTFVYPQPSGDLKPIDRWREENRRSDLFRQTWEYDIKVVNSSAAYLIKNAWSATAF